MYTGKDDQKVQIEIARELEQAKIARSQTVKFPVFGTSQPDPLNSKEVTEEMRRKQAEDSIKEFNNLLNSSEHVR